MGGGTRDGQQGSGSGMGESTRETSQGRKGGNGDTASGPRGNIRTPQPWADTSSGDDSLL